MEKTLFYSFISGIFVGKFTNIVSSAIITGTVLYFTEPDFYTYENLKNTTDLFIAHIK